jgi:hypothetical protein
MDKAAEFLEEYFKLVERTGYYIDSHGQWNRPIVLPLQKMIGQHPDRDTMEKYRKSLRVY